MLMIALVDVLDVDPAPPQLAKFLKLSWVNKHPPPTQLLGDLDGWASDAVPDQLTIILLHLL